jgi:4-diphosphocytidyl-2-C-methyl-D-erythritol kinase
MLERANGEILQTMTPDRLVDQALGQSLPVQGLRAWLRTQQKPQPGMRVIERDAQGRIVSFEQDGWSARLSNFDALGPRLVSLLRSETGSQDVGSTGRRLTVLYDLPAPAKLNLFLHVVGRRDDGYHLLQTVFRLISLADRIDVDLRRDGNIVRETDMLGVPHGEDLVVRAARALQAHTGTKLGAQIKVKKNIPAGGGLGGGSSDAATVLLALNRLWETRLSRAALMQLGLGLGADVPVFIAGQNAFAQGIGEQLTPVKLPERSYVVVQPAQSVPTAAVFGASDLTRDTDPVKMTDFSGVKLFAEFCGEIDQQSSFLQDFGRNDLQPVVLKRYPVVRQALDWLTQAGLDARMTGSGACLFVGFPGVQQAAAVHQKLLAKTRTDFSSAALAGVLNPIQSILVCEGLSEHPMRHWIES